MSDRSVTLNRTCFSATGDQAVPRLISPHKASMGFAILMCWNVGGTAPLPKPQGQAGSPSPPTCLRLISEGTPVIARRGGHTISTPCWWAWQRHAPGDQASRINLSHAEAMAQVQYSVFSACLMSLEHEDAFVFGSHQYLILEFAHFEDT